MAQVVELETVDAAPSAGDLGSPPPSRRDITNRRLLIPLVPAFALAAVAAAAARPPLPASPPAYGVAMAEAWIPMADGVRLAADIWRPKGAAGTERLPVLLEYLPYRKTESRGATDPLYAYFVRRGFVVARVDIRGTGNSEGTLIPYEYSDIEHADGDRVIACLP